MRTVLFTYFYFSGNSVNVDSRCVGHIKSSRSSSHRCVTSMTGGESHTFVMEWLRCLRARGLTGPTWQRGSRAVWKYPQCSNLAPPFTVADKAQLNVLLKKKKEKRKRTQKNGKPDMTNKMMLLFSWISLMSASGSRSRDQPGSGGGMVWSCYCWHFFNSASASWTEDAERLRGGAKGVCVCVKIEHISLCIICLQAKETPSVSMGTGKTPCTFHHGRGEAPVFRWDRGDRNGPAWPDALCNVCVVCREITQQR